jgi:pyridoxal phosphate phosphatase PHOSPHO2
MAKAPQPYRAIAYVGDSTNDFCPAMELRAGDVCLARKGMALEKLLGAKKERVRCDVVVWDQYADILACFTRIFSS